MHRMCKFDIKTVNDKNQIIYLYSPISQHVSQWAEQEIQCNNITVKDMNRIRQCSRQNVDRCPCKVQYIFLICNKGLKSATFNMFSIHLQCFALRSWLNYVTVMIWKEKTSQSKTINTTKYL